METLITSATKAIRSLFTPGMFGIFFASVFITICALGGFIVFSVLIVDWISWMIHPTGDMSGLATLGTFFLSSVIAWFLFPGIMPLVVNFFDVKIARAIEAKDYPQSQPPAIDPPFWPEFWHDARFSLLALTLNILALPLYFIPPLNLFVFYGLNGWLLGREFFVMAARRHISLPEAATLRKQHAGIVFFAGVALTFCATLPLINLLAPFWGVALMTHLYHALPGKDSHQSFSLE